MVTEIALNNKWQSNKSNDWRKGATEQQQKKARKKRITTTKKQQNKKNNPENFKFDKMTDFNRVIACLLL
jgi:hypothetical protein